MATAWVKGSASILWTPNGGSEITHLLAVPLGVVRELTPARVWGEHHDWWAAGKRGRRIVTIGLPGVREIVGVNRLENDPVGFMYMLEQLKLYDIEAIYLPDESGPEFPFRLVNVPGSPPDGISIEQDRHRFGAGEWERAMHMRRTDGGTFDALIG